MPTQIDTWVAEARAGTNPPVICGVPSGWLMLAAKQILRGSCTLVADPVVPALNALDTGARTRFLLDMALVGDALLDVTGAERINYEILGNQEPALHAHLHPRYADEPPERRREPVRYHDWDSAPTVDLARDRSLMDAIAAALERRLAALG